MQAYKFKSSRQMDHIFDVLQNRRLFCADWSSLNDPMEGVFAYSAPKSLAGDATDFATDIRSKMKAWRVCSLSGTFNSHLLWSHYANGFDGVAIEVELPDNHADIQAVKYRGVYGGYSYRADIDPEEMARSIIFSKYREWSYEQEIRIRSNDNYYSLENPIRRVIAGHRLKGALFDTLQMVCEGLEIEFRQIGIGDERLDADFVLPLKERKQAPVD